jgi:hypothetical protein
MERESSTREREEDYIQGFGKKGKRKETTMKN